MKQSRIRYKSFDQISIADSLVYSKLPRHPFWSNIEAKIDFSFADSLCAVLYSERGQHPYAPSLKLKIHLIQTYYNLSDRQTEEKIMGDLFIKRFLGLPVDFFGFDHSTIGLDRSRMGAAMFHACHLYILAQMYSSHGLWGDANEQWIIDSFPSQASLAMVNTCQLIRQSIENNLRHLERKHPAMYARLKQSVPLDAMDMRISANSSKGDRMVAFSKLVAQAYGLLQWFETEEAMLLFSHWPDKQAQQKSLELRAVLKQILEENTRPYDPNRGGKSSRREDEASEPLPNLAFEKIPRDDRPKNRIVSAYDPEARIAKKSKTVKIQGYKIQNLCTSSGVILETRAIPATEHDRDAMVDMVKGTADFFRTLPSAVLGDTLYGHGKQRAALAAINVSVVAPVTKTQNPTGLFDISRFTYNRDTDTYCCPNGKETIRKARNNKLEGWQHFFAETDCGSCSSMESCTTGKCRSIFHSDYYDLYEAASVFNETTEGRALHLLRYIVERKTRSSKLIVC